MAILGPSNLCNSRIIDPDRRAPSSTEQNHCAKIRNSDSRCTVYFGACVLRKNRSIDLFYHVDNIKAHSVAEKGRFSRTLDSTRQSTNQEPIRFSNRFGRDRYREIENSQSLSSIFNISIIPIFRQS